MLIISVVVVAIVAAAYAFVPTFREGVNDLALDVQSILSTGQIGSVGTPRKDDNYNTASNNARRCTEQKADPRYAAMFDPPKCLEDPVLVPAAAPAPATLVQREVPEPRAAHAGFEQRLPGRPAPPPSTRETNSIVAIVSSIGVPARRGRRAARRRA